MSDQEKAQYWEVIVPGEDAWLFRTVEDAAECVRDKFEAELDAWPGGTEPFDVQFRIRFLWLTLNEVEVLTKEGEL